MNECAPCSVLAAHSTRRPARATPQIEGAIAYARHLAKMGKAPPPESEGEGKEEGAAEAGESGGEQGEGGEEEEEAGEEEGGEEEGEKEDDGGGEEV